VRTVAAGTVVPQYCRWVWVTHYHPGHLQSVWVWNPFQGWHWEWRYVPGYYTRDYVWICGLR
jgi:hypothetical protein